MMKFHPISLPNVPLLKPGLTLALSLSLMGWGTSLALGAPVPLSAKAIEPEPTQAALESPAPTPGIISPKSEALELPAAPPTQPTQVLMATPAKKAPGYSADGRPTAPQSAQQAEVVNPTVQQQPTTKSASTTTSVAKKTSPNPSSTESTVGKAKPSPAVATKVPGKPSALSSTNVRPTGKIPPAVLAKTDIQYPLVLLREVTIPLTGYAGLSVPESFSTASQVLPLLESNEKMGTHMEILRRAYHSLPESEKVTLIQALYNRYDVDAGNPVKFFDHGYAQLVFNQNKTGLFFLRKANDKLLDPFVSLAYAMAQAEVDLAHEKATPDAINMRKMDVNFRLSEAIQRDKTDHQPGFWPVFGFAVGKLSQLAAYSDLANRDFSEAYVPLGNTRFNIVSKPMSKSGLVVSGSSKVTAAAFLAVSDTCSPQAGKQEATLTEQTPAYSRSVETKPGGSIHTINYYRTTGETQPYRVLVQDEHNRLLADFPASVGPAIVEDLDGDGTFELVLRQFQQDRLHPVQVYRWTGCEYRRDGKIDALFQ
jgi:hypothetical protein